MSVSCCVSTAQHRYHIVFFTVGTIRRIHCGAERSLCRGTRVRQSGKRIARQTSTIQGVSSSPELATDSGHQFECKITKLGRAIPSHMFVANSGGHGWWLWGVLGCTHAPNFLCYSNEMPEIDLPNRVLLVMELEHLVGSLSKNPTKAGMSSQV